MLFKLSKKLEKFLESKGLLNKAIHYSEKRNEELDKPFTGTYHYLESMFDFEKTIEGKKFWLRISEEI
jgi:hypothetical protein